MRGNECDYDKWQTGADGFVKFSVWLIHIDH
jgi:hypothetical protein